MREEKLSVADPSGRETVVPLRWVHTLVVGSGAAGLGAAVQLRAAGVDDVLIVTEGLEMGTSINAGSDKQTYYKLSMCGDEADSPRRMAETYFDGGGMHGDLALVEASLSARAFFNLVNLGLPFPRDTYGQFVGYKTDHDPRQRATSIGPYTSREMCRAPIGEVRRLEIPVLEQRNVVALLSNGEGAQRRALGAVVVDDEGSFEAIGAENVVFAVGGPGGLYHTSVYPMVHTGAIGLALMAGAKAQNLSESQFGMASTKFRWNVSGTYMQVVPRLVSTAADGTSDAREFLLDYFDSVGQMCSRVFMKGYQWPFDSGKVVGGSSLIDILVYIETVEKGRRVFLDFCANPEGFRFEDLEREAYNYLRRSDALHGTPIERLTQMNPAAVQLYREHGIDITNEPLEIAVCAQHNNGGMAANHWWESSGLRHCFPVGEVNGSHGVYRPGGAALNAGQVGGIRAAEYIAGRYAGWSIEEAEVKSVAALAVAGLTEWLQKGQRAPTSWQQEREEFQRRMSCCAAHVRSAAELARAVTEAWEQYDRIEASGCRYATASEAAESLRNRHLCFAHAVYLEAVCFVVENGVGSRGSAMVLDPHGAPISEQLDNRWRLAAEDVEFRHKVLETVVDHRRVENQWVDQRPIPETDVWFETVWAQFRDGALFD